MRKELRFGLLLVVALLLALADGARESGLVF